MSSGASGTEAIRRLVAELLHELGHSLQANQKTLEGASDADRDAQFERFGQRVKTYQAL
jgi:hypothetical protein